MNNNGYDPLKKRDSQPMDEMWHKPMQWWHWKLYIMILDKHEVVVKGGAEEWTTTKNSSRNQ